MSPISVTQFLAVSFLEPIPAQAYVEVTHLEAKEEPAASLAKIPLKLSQTLR